MKNLDKEKVYRVVWDGVKGTIEYFYVYVNAWMFCPDEKDASNSTNYEAVTDVQIAEMKIRQTL